MSYTYRPFRMLSHLKNKPLLRFTAYTTVACTIFVPN